MDYQIKVSPPNEENNENEQTETTSYNDKFNNTYDLVSLMMYLTGIEFRHFSEHTPDLTEKFNTFDKDKNAKIIRNLCIIRNALEKNYVRINNSFRYDLKNLSSLPDLIPTDAVTELEQENIRIQKINPDIVQYIITINTELSNRINNVKPLFPEWVNWQYIRPLFMMPNGFNPAGVKAAGDFYNSNRNRYPYQCYLNWQGGGRWKYI